jgi:phosphonate transport system ATP-binding protein
MVALIGASGSGKSTLLRMIAGLMPCDRSNGGEIIVAGNSIQRAGRLSKQVRRARTGIGFVFQQFNLVDRLPVLTNVLIGTLGRIPLYRSMLGWFTAEERHVALAALLRVGIGAQAHQRASTLSGGQQQRAAIARALTQKAGLILADEPIASLDPASSRNVMEILADINRQDRITVVVSLHQVDYARRFCPRVIALKEGIVAFDGPSSQLTNDRLQEIYGIDSDIFGDDETEPTRVPPRLITGAGAFA